MIKSSIDRDDIIKGATGGSMRGCWDWYDKYWYWESNEQPTKRRKIGEIWREKIGKI